MSAFEAELRAQREENERLTRERDELARSNNTWCAEEYARRAERDTARRERDEAKTALLEAIEVFESIAKTGKVYQHQCLPFAERLRKRGGITGTEGSGT